MSIKSLHSRKPDLSLDSSLVQDDLPLEVIPGIFLGSIHSAFNLEAINKANITHVSIFFIFYIIYL